MTDLNATILAKIDTRDGTAFGVLVEGGIISVGDFVGLYLDQATMPYSDATVREIRYGVAGAVKQVGSTSPGFLNLKCAVFLENDPALRVGTKLGPKFSDRAQEFGIKPDDLR